MARQARIEYKGALYHLTSRGNAQQDIYRSDEDRFEFLDILRRSRNRYNCTIYAYCLMDNHWNSRGQVFHRAEPIGSSRTPCSRPK